MLPLDRPTLLFRADAGPGIGAGHIMRCLALAQGWIDRGGSALLLTSPEVGPLADRWRSAGAAVEHMEAKPGSAEDAQATLEATRRHGAEHLVVDGYTFDSTYQATLSHAIPRLLWIDDFAHATPYSAPLILNQNLSAKESLYARRPESTRLLLGPRYALLRREFLDAPEPEPTPQRAHRLLVTLGGSDPTGLTGQLLARLCPNPLGGAPRTERRLFEREAGEVGGRGRGEGAGGASASFEHRPQEHLRADSDKVERECFGPRIAKGTLEVQLVVGGLDPRRTELERRAADLGPGLSLVVDVQNMAPLMTRAHLALSAAGSTVWELAHLGVPALLVVVAENQRGNAEALHRLGVAHNLGDATTLDGEVLESTLDALLEDPDRRTQMSRRGRELVDGRGVERVVAAILGEELVP